MLDEEDVEPDELEAPPLEEALFPPLDELPSLDELEHATNATMRLARAAFRITPPNEADR